ncbi:MAG: hypothetical protein KAR54_00005 [Candidatus Pacebacteria bacterium]|nr:hypothetical protein [Candidatus Paceibacterota bacterium]
MHYKIAQLSLSPGRNASTSGDVFVAQPDSTKEDLAGKLFIIIEIENSNAKDLKIINFLIDNLNHNYYNSEKILLRERISSLKVEHIFEAALAKTNKSFNAFLESNKFSINPNSINATAGIIHKDDLYLANRGKNKALLIYKKKNKDSQEESTYSSVNIFNEPDQNDKTTASVNNLKKLFSNVISGKIPENGQFIISNEALPEYLSSKQIIDISSTLPPMSAVEQIKNTLAKINTYISFFGILIKSSKSHQEYRQTTSSQGAENSIINLNKTEEKTENLLTPSGSINIKKWLKWPSLLIKNKKTSSQHAEQSLGLKDRILVKKNPLNFKIGKKIFGIIKNIFIYIINFLFFIFKTCLSRQKLSTFLRNLKENGKNLKEKITILNKKNKFLIIIFSFFILLFIINIGLQKKEEIKEEEEKNYQELNILIEQKQNQAEANLLYSNDKGALEAYEEVKKLLEELPQETEEQIQKHEIFKEKYDQFLAKIRKITKIQSEEISNFNNLIKDANPDNIISSLGNNKIYAGDSAQKSIYILDTLNNSATILAELARPISSLLYPAKSDSGQIYYYNNNNIINFDIASETLGELNIALNQGSIASADTYNNRLYLLDTNQGQILRFNRNGQSFSAPYAWSQANSDLKEALDMSIDGNIYVLLKNGEVVKFLRGETIDFKLELVDPPLSNPTKILSPMESDYLYILEPENSRVIVYDKEGEFQIQYQADNLKNIKDFQIDENNKTIYFLDNSSVYKAEMIHF